MPCFFTHMPALGRASRAQRLARRRASYRPSVEALEARDLMSTGGTISGVVFNDAITNGMRDAGELPLAGVTIFADSNGNGVLDAGEVSTRSGADGSYSLALSQDGTFRPRQVEPLGFAETAGAGAVALSGGAAIGNINFGDRRTLPPNQSFVDQVFRDLLGRGADAGAQAFFGGALDQGSFSRQQVALIIENSTEFRSLQIDSLFKTLLHRAADPMGKQAFLAFFAAGATTAQAEAVILASPEYFQTRGSGSTTGYATALFQDLFGRSIDPAGLTSVQNFLAAGGSRLALTQALLASPEADAREVRGLFQQLLHRDPDAGGLATFTAALHGGASDEHTAAVIASSDEYFQRFCL
ncbi:MAG TPA: DUF4214 domain-containing protein [Pirellulales bacterium]|nr:DUF4214 domain-containing protein [Pirellulales bacterium]